MNIINDMLVDKCFPDNPNARAVVPAYKDKTASGNPITLTDSAEQKPLGMKLYGWSKQDGEPSPDNPVEIKSAGDDGEIGVSVTGKNLFTLKDNYFYGYFTVTNNSVVMFRTNTIVYIPCEPNAKYFIYGVKNTNGNYCVSTSVGIPEHTTPVKGAVKVANNDSIFYTTANDAKYLLLFVLNDGDKATVETREEILKKIVKNLIISKKSQSTAITTPNGLPGIPVPSNTAGITYTDADGQAWIADEIDLERGKYVQRVWKGEFDGSSDEEWVLYQTAGYLGFAIDVLPQNMVRRYGFCTYYKLEYAATTDEAVWIGVDNKRIYVKNNSFYDGPLADKGLSNFKSHLAANPLIVMTYLDVPIERDLTSAELAEYTQLYSYNPTTVVENDSGCWMDVTYKAGTSGKTKNKALRWYFKNVMPLVE